MKKPTALTLQAAPRFLLFLTIWLSLFAYAGRPLLVAAHLGGIPRAAAWGMLAVLALTPALAMRRNSWLHAFGYSTLAVFSTLLVLVFAGDVIRVVSYAPIDARLLSLGTLGAAAMLSLVGLVQARCPRVRRVEVGIDALPEDLDGYRIVQWSDVHVGPTIRRRFVASLVERTNALAPDAIAITGDLVDGSVADLREQVAPLRDLRAKDGVYFVTGNHEYYWRAAEWVREIERLGITVLGNRHELIARGTAQIAMAGVTDPVSRNTDVAAALAGAPRDAIKVLLSHRPQTAKEASDHGAHLQLSGHTHGGQFFPFNLLIRLFQPVVAGLHKAGGAWLYVSRGTGYWGPPSRLGVHGEITEIVLRRA